jgi:hypothetical protein
MRTLQLQNTYFIKVIQNPGTSSAKLKELKNLQTDNMFQILDFLDKKKKYEKMLEEVDTYV